MTMNNVVVVNLVETEDEDNNILCLNTAMDTIVNFNECAGNHLDDVTYEGLFSQTKLVSEEAEELNTAVAMFLGLKNKTITLDQVHEVTGKDDYDTELEILDGICDVLVVALQALAQIEVLGFDVNKAFDKISDNNLNKILVVKEEAEEQAKLLQDNLGETIIVKEVDYEGRKYYTLRDVNGKIRKPVGFVGVDISDCIPSYINCSTTKH